MSSDADRRAAPRVRRHGWADLVGFEVDEASAEPKMQQVYKSVQRAILSGAAPLGSRLPSTRELVLAMYRKLYPEEG